MSYTDTIKCNVSLAERNEWMLAEEAGNILDHLITVFQDRDSRDTVYI